MDEVKAVEARGAAATHRVFLLGAGFSKPAGLPLAAELLPLVRDRVQQRLSADGFTHLDRALERYSVYQNDVEPGTAFDLEQFAAWLDWDFVLRLRGSDTFSNHGNEDALQLRWGLANVLFEAMPKEAPPLYVEFARRLNVTDRVLTLNYDLLLERALQEVGLPYRRYPGRYSEVYDTHSVWDPDEPPALMLIKLHGSLDWTYFTDHRDEAALGLQPLVEGPRPADDPLSRVATVPADKLEPYYASKSSWWRHPPLLMPPSRAKPLAGSPLIPLWDGVGLYAHMYGGFTVIGCSLPPGDPYVVQLVHHICTDYASGRARGGVPWPQGKIKIVDLRQGPGVREIKDRFRFVPPAHGVFALEGFDEESLKLIFELEADA